MQGDYEEDQDRWVPPREWTAWPVKPDELPPDDFMPVQPLDEDSPFTYRKRQTVFPRSALSEEIEGHILHLANKKFMERERAEKETSTERNSDDGEAENPASDDQNMRSRVSTEVDSTDSEMEDPRADLRVKSGQQSSEVRIVPTADDDTSSAILRPAVSDIITKLEKTLTVLHNMMVATTRTSNNNDNGNEDWETELDEPSRSRSGARSRKRAAKRPRPPSVLSETEPDEPTPLRSPQKKPRHDSAPPTPEGTQKDTTSIPVEGKSSPESGPPRERVLHRRASRLNRLRPRDWHTVLGAASIAGFSKGAVHRAAQRCANLFGEGAELQILNDHSPTRDTYVSVLPGREIPVEEDDREFAEVTRIRLAARDASRAKKPPSRSRSANARSRSASRTGRSRTASASCSRSRSRSATPHLVCPHRTCPRSVESFSRRGNLMRHLELVHGGDEGGGVEVDSEDEVEGGVHVDGFLRAIRPRRGWRGEGVKTEERRRGRERGERRGRRVKVEDENENEEEYCFSGALGESE